MPSNFASYKKEREGVETVEDQHGFATYKFVEDGVYIEDLYVVPEKRESKLASKYADKVVAIAREKGYTKLFGSVCYSDPNATTNLHVLLGYGFNLLHGNKDMIYFVKEIK